MRYIAFIRAINVAGHARVKMTDVKDVFAAAGCTGVQTYIQSGNVVFDVPAARREAVFRRVRLALRTLIEEEPGLMFRSVAELEAILANAPFKPGDPRLKLYVVFLAGKPKKTPALPFRSVKDKLDAVAVKGLEAFVVSRRKPNGFYGFPNSFIEGALGVLATSRNLSTVAKLVEFTRSPQASPSVAAVRRRRGGHAGSRSRAS